MYLVIRRADNTVAQVQEQIPLGAFDPAAFEIKEWHGQAPPVHDPELGVESYDPTLTDPDYPDLVQKRACFDDLRDKADGEIQWLQDSIPLVDMADLDTLRGFLKRVMRQQLEEMRAWRYIFACRSSNE